MRTSALATALVAVSLLHAQQDRSTRHLIGATQPLTAPRSRPAAEIAQEFLQQTSGQLGKMLLLC